MTETPSALELARRKLTKKNAGGGSGNMPLRRRYVREFIEQKPKHGGAEMTIPRLKGRIAEIDREIATSQLRNNTARLSEAEALNARAAEYASTHGTDHVTAVREVARLDALKLSQEPSVADVEQRMKEDGVGFEDALHSILQSGRYDAPAAHVGGGSGLSDADYDEQLKTRMKEMSYEVE